MKKPVGFLIALTALLGCFLSAQPASALNCAGYPYTLQNGQLADANQVMANFNNILSCGNNNLAKNGANSDITSLSGLTTPLSAAQGGTGSTTIIGGLGYTPAHAGANSDITSLTGLTTPLSAAQGGTGNTAGNVPGNAATATLATKASTLASGGGGGTAMTFTYGGSASNPVYAWGSNGSPTDTQLFTTSTMSVATAAALTTGDKTIQGTLFATNSVAPSGSVFPAWDGSGNFAISQNGTNPNIQRIVNFTSGRYVAWNQNTDTVIMAAGSAYVQLTGGTGRVDISAPGGLYVNGVLMNVP